MYPTTNSFLEKETPSSPTFVNISSTQFDYPLPSGKSQHRHHHNHHHHHHHTSGRQHTHHPSMKFAKTKAGLVTSSTIPTDLDQTELIFPDDAYSIEDFCLPNDICPISTHRSIADGTTYRDGSRRKCKNKPEISNRWTKKSPNCTTLTAGNSGHQNIISLDNYCTPKQLQQQQQQQQQLAPLYDVYSYAYLEPTVQQQQQSGELQLNQHSLHQHSAAKQHKQASTSSATSTTSSSSSTTSFMPIYGGGPSTSSGGSTSSSSKSPSRNSIKALLAKSFRSRNAIATATTVATVSTSHGNCRSLRHQQQHRSNSASNASGNNPAEKYTYTTRYGTTENLYEEVNEDKILKMLSVHHQELIDNNDGNVEELIIQAPPPPPPVNSKEEQRRVQNTHFRILDELNLSLEALIMPPTPPSDTSPTINSPEHLLNGSKSVENLSTSNDFKENLKERFYFLSRNRKVDCVLADNKSNNHDSNNDQRFTTTTMSTKRNLNLLSKSPNHHDGGIAMTLISPTSPFKSMRRYFETQQNLSSTATAANNDSIRSKNSKFWTIRQ